MAKKQFFLIIDTETTQDQMVADFAAVICDRKGRIHNQCAVLIDGVFTDYEKHPLFFDSSASPDTIWSRSGADRRYATYENMVAEGSRMIASVTAVNRWLERARGKYNPALTAYNLAFDTNKMENTGIDSTIFSQRFCLWHAAAGKWARSKKYRQFILDNHGFNAPTKMGNMTYKTNAEIMTRFVLGQPDLENEPHTALEDIIGYELPILQKLVSLDSLEKIIANSSAYNWRDFQVKNNFKV